MDGYFNERFDVNYCVDRKKGFIFFVCFLLKKMKLVDMLGSFGGRSDMVDNNYIGVFFVIINVLMLWNNMYM